MIHKFNLHAFVILTFVFLCYNKIALSQPNLIVSQNYLINKNLPLYECKLFQTGIDTNNQQPKYEIQVLSGGREIQMINLDTLDETDDVWLEDSLIDINFDGYKDLLISIMKGGGGKNHIYGTWLFDTTNSKFILSPEFTGLCNPEVDYTNKLIIETSLNGCGSQCYTINTYKILNNKLSKIKSIDQYWDDNTGKFRRIIETYKNGKEIYKKEIQPKEL
jgi:hypothetical protein